MTRFAYIQELLDCAVETNRLDANNPQCKRGKPCNGRCIPQSHQCQQRAAAGTGLKVIGGLGAAFGAAYMGKMVDRYAEKAAEKTEQAIEKTGNRVKQIYQKARGSRGVGR